MKAIYTVVNGRVYNINQDTKLPNILTRKPSIPCSAVASNDSSAKLAGITITLSTFKTTGIESNKEMYNKLERYLREHEITEIDTIQNKFKVCIDYIMEEGGHEICHSIMIKPLKPVDVVVPLGVGTNNECVYRRAKQFKQSVEFITENSLPFGIMKNVKRTFKLKINNISVFQDFSPLEEDNHESYYATPYGMNSVTIDSGLSNMIMIYSTKEAGISIQELEVGFNPRKILVDLNMLLSDYIVAYNDGEINTIIEENIENKYKEDEDTPETPDDPDSGVIIPDKEDKPSADGDVTPDKSGWYDYYERCTDTNPNALLVVEDMMPDSIYDVDKMIRKSDVIKDIPDITIGEYVIYTEGLITTI